MPIEISRCLLVFQNVANQSESGQNLNFWLVLAGILIIFFCLLAVFVPNVKSLITSPQEFSGLGVNMRVSILTVFVLMGFILSLSSFALQWRGFMTREEGYKEEISKLKFENKQFEERENRARKFNMTVVLKPKGLDEILSTDDWTCVYYLEDSYGKPSRPVQAPLNRAKDGKRFKVTLDDLTPETRIYSIKLKKGDKVWSVEGVFPLREGTFEVEPTDEGGESDES